MRINYNYGLREEERRAALEVLKVDKFTDNKQKRKSARYDIYTFLKTKGIYVSIHYHNPAYDYFKKQVGLPKQDFPVTSKTAKEVISIPMWPQLNRKQIRCVVDSIKDFISTAIGVNNVIQS